VRVAASTSSGSAHIEYHGSTARRRDKLLAWIHRSANAWLAS
jgi:hypothetical protein